MSNNSHAEILIVDDDSTSRKILAHLLVSAGYKCLECEDGTKALQTIQDRQPALDAAPIATPKRLARSVAQQSRARPGGRTVDPAIPDSAKTPCAARMGGCDLLSSSHPGGRRYLWMAANERWPDLILDRRWNRPRRGCGAADHSRKTPFSPWQRGT